MLLCSRGKKKAAAGSFFRSRELARLATAVSLTEACVQPAACWIIFHTARRVFCINNISLIASSRRANYFSIVLWSQIIWSCWKSFWKQREFHKRLLVHFNAGGRRTATNNEMNVIFLCVVQIKDEFRVTPPPRLSHFRKGKKVWMTANMKTEDLKFMNVSVCWEKSSWIIILAYCFIFYHIKSVYPSCSLSLSLLAKYLMSCSTDLNGILRPNVLRTAQVLFFAASFEGAEPEGGAGVAPLTGPPRCPPK